VNVYKNARLTQHRRAEVLQRVQAGQPPMAVATAFGVDGKTVAKWVKRFVAEGLAGLSDRSSRPHRLHRPTLAPAWSSRREAPVPKPGLATRMRSL